MNILFLFNQGSEVRQFLYSGVISELNKEHNIFISLRVKDKEVISLFNEYNINIVEYYRDRMPFKFNFFSKILNDSNKNKQTWRYFNNEIKLNSLLKKGIYSSLYFIFLNLGKFKFFQNYLKRYLTNFDNKFQSKKWENLLLQNKIEQFVINVPNVNYDLLYSCKKLNIPVKLLFHTNKDIYTLGKIFFPYKKIGVWNTTMKKKLIEFNSSFKSDDVEIIGCSHFSYLSSLFKYKEAKQSIKIDNRIINILYISAAPFVVENEIENINILETSLFKLGISDYKIIIKTNPMDDTNYWDNFESKNIQVYKSEWRWNNKEAFNFPYKSELFNFKYLLSTCNLVIGLPSTVSLEAAIVGIPNLNICTEFGKIKSIYSNIKDMWDAPFYENVRTYKAAIPIYSENELIESLKKILLQNHKLSYDNFIKNELDVDLNYLTKNSVKFIG